MAEDVDKTEAPDAAPAESGSARGGMLGTVLAALLVTVVAGGAGGGLGIYLAGAIETTIEEKAASEPDATPDVRYSGDMVLLPLEPVVTNLADPSDTWIRLETAIIFTNGTIENPEVTGAEIRQDVLAFARTLPLTRLEGPSALQHLREDLNERAAIRTNGLVEELIIETMVLQ